MSKIIELREKRNAAMRSAQAILLQDTVTNEDRAKADQIFAEVDAMESQIEGLERVERFEAEQRSIPQVPRPNPGQSAEMSADEKRSANRKAMETFIRRGAMTDGLETRDLTTGNTGVVIPQGFYPVLTDAQKAFGGVANLVAKRNTDNGAPMKMALDNDTANGLVVVGEQGPLTETDPAFTGQTISTDEVSTGIVKVSWAELSDSAFNLDAFIRDKFGKRYARGLAQMITAGNGSNVAGLLTVAPVGATSAAPASLAYPDLTALYGALDPAYEASATWTMNSTTRAALMGVLSTTGQPIFIPNPQSGAFDTLFGRPVVLNQYLQNIAAGNVAVQYGAFDQGYLLRTVGDLAIVRLNERFADTLSVGFLGYARIGGIATDAGTHPILSLKQHA